ncbi:hypothetical protein DFH06DRAFT_1167737 [Mycena polygramma]|nr:hypothetical protein DFH06DRAFT_1167737 [Mycena polygramma]
MSLFSSSSGFQINGGSFYDVAGNVNVDTTQYLESASSQDRQLSGADRTRRHAWAARGSPYDTSSRARLPGHSQDFDRFLLPSLPDPPSPPSLSGSNRQVIPELLNDALDIPDGVTPHVGPLHSERWANGSPSTGNNFEGISSGHHRVPSYTVASYEGSHPEPRTNTINGGTFIAGNVNHIRHQGQPGLHILYHAAAGDAAHDSEDRFPQPKCHPETRAKLLDVLWDWASCGMIPEGNRNSGPSSDSSSTVVVWLHGPAGAGKSAIAQSLCQKLEEGGRLGASFFFKRGHPSRGHAKRLFATIAYHLALRFPDLNRHISAVLESDPSLVDRSISIQLQKFIVEPLQHFASTHIPRDTLVVVIDGLDECEDRKSQREILRCIGHAFNERRLPLRILVTSRPEPHIREIVVGALNKIHHPLNIEQSFEDVETFLLDEFARIHREHRITMATVPRPWPSPQEIHNLVEKSSGYFIYASTVIKFVDDRNFRPTERLAIIVGMAESPLGSPFAALDQLYTQILSEVHPRPQLLKILMVIASPLPLSPTHIEQLVGLELGDVSLVLHGLHSVVGGLSEENEEDGSNPPYCQAREGLVCSPDILPFVTRKEGLYVYHASFGDFLHDPGRAGSFYIGSCSHRMELARCVLKAFAYKHDNAFFNRRSHVSWHLRSDAFKCIAVSPPCSELVTLLESFNPDFLFHQSPNQGFRGLAQNTEMILEWLKISLPIPEATIQLWEDYRFMLSCESVWSYPTRAGLFLPLYPEENEVTEQDRENYRQLLSRSLPSTVRILQAVKFIPDPWNTIGIFKLHLLLELPWDQLRTAICSLRSLACEDIRVVFVALDPHIFPGVFGSLMLDLARGHLNVMLRIHKGELARHLVWSLLGWSRFLRACPPSEKLLGYFCDISSVLEGPHPFGDEIHNAVQWLKTYPQAPLELIGRWEGFLDGHLCRIQSTFSDIDEDLWIRWYQRQRSYLDLEH